MCPVGRKDRSIDLNVCFCRNILFITVAVIVAVVERYIKAQAFSVLDSLYFELGLDGSGLGLIIFHNLSPRTHHNYL